MSSTAQPSSKALGKRRAINTSPSPQAEPSSKKQRAESPVDDQDILQSPPESPSKHSAMFSSDDADDDDEVIIVSHSKPLPVAANTDGNHAANADSDSVTKFKSAPFYDLTCPICFDSPRPLVATNCGHAFCGPCLFNALTSQTNKDTYMASYDPILRSNIIKASQGQLVNGNCPVCRKDLKGGWGSAARGLMWKVGRRKKMSVAQQSA